MTFEEALEAQLKKLDEAFAEMRLLHSDLNVLNRECTEMQDAAKRIDEFSHRIFQIKNLLDELK